MNESTPDAAAIPEDDLVSSELEHFATAAAPVWPVWIAAATACLWVAWGTLSPAYLAGWIGVYGAFMVGRFLLFRRYLRSPRAVRRASEALWRRRFIWMMAGYATLQMALIAVAVLYAAPERAFLLTVMIALSAATMTSIMPLDETTLRVYLLMTLPVTGLAWLLSGKPYGILVAVAMLVATAIYYKAGLHRLGAVRQALALEAKLAHSNQLLRTLNVSRTRLVMEASHDLRQPVQALALLVDSLRQAREGPDFETRMRDIEACTGNLADMLNELMEFSRIDLGNYSPRSEPIHLREVLDEIRILFAGVARSKNLRWEVSTCADAVMVRSNPWLIRRILINVVGNALKYTPSGYVTIDCSEISGAAQVHVRDSGPGIPERDQDHVFTEYVRVGDTAGSEPGMGIGLAFAKRAATVLGHQLAMVSTVGQGTVMTLTLQTVADTSAAIQQPWVESGTSLSQLAGRQVILIENDEVLRHSLANALRGWGVSVHEFSSADRIAQSPSLQGIRPDLLLVDLHLDGKLNGLDASQSIRQHFGHAELPVLLLTGDLSAEVEREAKRHHIRMAYKPLRPARLRSLLASSVAGRVLH